MTTVRCFLFVGLLISCLASLATAENRLGKETSPYLRLHAHNPVDWYPWGPEALAKAKKENKVIFLSVGYSSCYWCHVMERESFMDDEIAKYLNEHFVCIKVDREERPDLDAIYMLAVQIANQGRGGWPMTVFMTPDAKPFYGGTYFPARDGDRGPRSRGFLTLATTIQGAWESNPDGLISTATQLTEIVRRNINGAPPEDAEKVPLEASLLDNVQKELVQQFDPQYGGFGFDPSDPSRPKFPEPSNLYFLLHQARQGDEKALQILEVTLEKMHSGGIWDHVGGGFHRYSVDRFWQIPHFEKMLYDNGQLAVIYSQAYELTKKPAYKRVVFRMLDWVLREMRDEGGAFYAALDAESEKIEGKFYRWELSEVKTILGNEYEQFAKVYGLDDPPNFEHRFYVPQLSKSLAEMAANGNPSEEALWKSLEPSHQKLLAVRNKRVRPLTDTKVLASWNGLMIRGFAEAGRVFDRTDYTLAAAQAADFVLAKMRRDDGRLYRTHTAGESKLNAYLDDYAFLCDGLIALHRSTNESKWLTSAAELTDLQNDLFQDTERGGFYFTSKDHEALIARGKQPNDGAQPAGNSVAVENLVYLGANLNRGDYTAVAQKALNEAAPILKLSPRIAPRMAVALAKFLDAK